MMELIGGIVGALLTILILSYILGDNPLYRLALHVLVGASVGYAVAVAAVTVFRRAVLPALLQDVSGRQYGLIIPVLLGVLLLFKSVPRWASLGNFSTAFLIGVGAAVAMGGALLGTIVPQMSASGSLSNWIQAGPFGLVNGLVVMIGTVCALLAFTFTVREQPGVRGLFGKLIKFAGRIGRLFLLAAFGAMFAGAFSASASVLIGHVYALIENLQGLLIAFGGG